MSAGGYHHHIGLNTWESRGGSPPPPGTTGLYHAAILYPTRAALADALTRLMRLTFRWTLRVITALAKRYICAILTATALSFTGICRKQNGRARQKATLAMYTQPLDLQALLRAAD